MTDFENAAFAVFVVLLSRAILYLKLNFYIPISKVRHIFYHCFVVNWFDRSMRTWGERRRGMRLPLGSSTLERKSFRLFEAAHQAALRLLVLARQAMALQGRKTKR